MSRYRLQKSLVMIGMMGAGKTAVGMALARLLGVPFVDSDAEIEAAANQSVTELFEEFGEPFFREKEALVLARLLDGPAKVFSTGGGAFLHENNRAMIAEKGLSIWLKADRAILWSRVRHKTTRPLLQVPDPQARLYQLLDEREPIYRQCALIVEAEPQLSVNEMAQKVLQAVLDHPSGLLKQVA